MARLVEFKPAWRRAPCEHAQRARVRTRRGVVEIASAHVGAHSVRRIVVHLVWATGGRRPVLDVSLDEPLEPLLRQKASEQRAAFYAFGAACDHVHVLVQLDPMLGVATLVNRMKGASSHALRRRLVEGWQAGYGAESVSPDLVATTSRYVRGQRASRVGRPRRTLGDGARRQTGLRPTSRGHAPDFRPDHWSHLREGLETPPPWPPASQARRGEREPRDT